MIGKNDAQNSKITEEEVFENEENIRIEIENRRMSLRETERIIAEAEAFIMSDVYLLMQDDLNTLYQNAFSEAYSTDDAYKSKFALEQMKGIGKAMKVIDNLISNLKDDAENIGREIEEMESSDV